MRVVATAGHVDHGKSTLVEALTGMDPDRLEEEKRRGLTIDLGFAHTTLPSGQDLALVDVPGHVRFLKNMLAGVGAVEACLFVVAATEGWKPQSEEHLRILELVGVHHGIIALTMTGLVDRDVLTLARQEVSERVAGTFLERAEMVEVDSLTGSGIAEVALALDRLLATKPRPPGSGRPRLWVDRSFAPRGAGTVVTGTLTGGSISLGDDLVVEPGRRPVRVRALQSLHTERRAVPPGSRAAVNLSGIDHDDVSRGDALIREGQWHMTWVFDAAMTVLSSLRHEVGRRGAYVVYLGSGEHHAGIRVLDADALEPGEEGHIRVYLDTRLPLLPGDRFVIRETGRSETVGGGEVLDLDPVLPTGRARPDRSVDRVIRERGWVDVVELERLTGEVRAPSVGSWVADPHVLDETVKRVLASIAEAGALGLNVAELGEKERAVLGTLDGVRVEDGRAILAGSADELAEHPFLGELRAAGFAPPKPEGVDRGVLRALVRRGLVVESEGVYFSSEAVEAASLEMADLLRTRPDGFTVADARDRLHSSRKHVLPLLSHLDRHGVTRRRGDLRVAGPRLPGSRQT
ncbi:MAG: Sulfate adenylyltransferase subunit 1 [Acidimicrobiales bacterium]|nr:MAG: selenocysteine-specific translation elongation factor [Actinomycetota bacterium]MBV6508396.1 Sulfate adenylyltransferase subunit 1 [Acidimicrobiales bacterium]RIK04791.1 MAG: selenocysteine-specific translation elongation factor [Acidobacteriota bacterium]